jgi:hypothetical protein
MSESALVVAGSLDDNVVVAIGNHQRVEAEPAKTPPPAKGTRRVVRRTLSSPTQVELLRTSSNSSNGSAAPNTNNNNNNNNNNTNNTTNESTTLEQGGSSRSRRRKRKPSGASAAAVDAAQLPPGVVTMATNAVSAPNTPTAADHVAHQARVETLGADDYENSATGTTTAGDNVVTGGAGESVNSRINGGGGGAGAKSANLAAAPLTATERNWRAWFVESCGLDDAEAIECTNLFIHARIAPDQTTALTHDLLKDIGVRHVGVRMCIMRAPAPRPFLGGTSSRGGSAIATSSSASAAAAQTSSEDLATISSSASSPRTSTPTGSSSKSGKSKKTSRHAIPPVVAPTTTAAAAVAAAATTATATTATAMSPPLTKARRRRQVPTVSPDAPAALSAAPTTDKPSKMSSTKLRASASPLRVSDGGGSPRSNNLRHSRSSHVAAAAAANDDNDAAFDESDGRVVLNVGGTRFETYLSTLTRYPNTTLGTMFSERNRPMLHFNKQGEVFFDRSPALFEPILAFYRNGVLRRPPHVDPRLFAEECAFFGVAGAKRGAPRNPPMSFLGFGDEYDVSEDSLDSYELSDAWLDEWTDDEGDVGLGGASSIGAAVGSNSSGVAATTVMSSISSALSPTSGVPTSVSGASPTTAIDVGGGGGGGGGDDDLSPTADELHQSLQSLHAATTSRSALTGSAPSSPPPPARPGASAGIPIPSGAGRRLYSNMRSSSPPPSTSARTSGRDSEWLASPPSATSPPPMQSDDIARREQRQAALALQMRRHGPHRLGAVMATRSMSRLRHKVSNTLRRLLRHVVVAVRRAADVGNPSVTVEFREGLQSEFYGFLSNLACRELALHELYELQFDVSFKDVTSAGGGHSYVFLITLWNCYTGHETLNVRVTLTKVLDELRFISSKY